MTNSKGEIKRMPVMPQSSTTDKIKSGFLDNLPMTLRSNLMSQAKAKPKTGSVPPASGKRTLTHRVAEKIRAANS